MNDEGLFDATVPVFRHYIRRIEMLLKGLSQQQTVLLEKKLAPDAFSSAEHFQSALGFVHRTVLPLLARDVLLQDDEPCDREELIHAAQSASGFLLDVCIADFDGAANRLYRHTAGDAELQQDATTFVTLFSLPNFFFHASMGFAILRREGVKIGKADFDGQHEYANGFHF